ncbi:uncharacterized protein BBOV_IV005140 [Babesia bovis T2Bo]|uniref:Uncharacterized protein n=1 Tax=Babesia bovis TaxID=5865 RepID=A7AQQ6_BABBO|nr:uncharacterized protein BBOV_IV005140 [Babesia bovis T2Bo]EDO06875.1 hypothetical protein BBOV_IV005140 [Babesia bovis T2Bo]|eukprot:XP_001610443.1 hypothetical protein [Babesia bovis T2Bo]
METAVSKTPHYKETDKEIQRNDNRTANNIFDDVATYIIVDKNDQDTNNKVQAGHKWTETDNTLGNQKNETKPVVDAKNNDKQESLSEILQEDNNKATEEKYEWKPGFCLQLGSQGRKAMLQLLRNVCKNNKSCRNIFQKMDPPTTISNLPFFKVSMLWELAYQLNVFDQAIEIHKSYCKCKLKGGKCGDVYSRAPNVTNVPVQNSGRTHKTKRIRPSSIIKEFYQLLMENENLYTVMPNDGMRNLKRKMENLVSAKKVTPEQFSKFMGSYKPNGIYNEALHHTEDAHGLQKKAKHNNLYEYIPRLNKPTYPCSTMGCAVMHP